MSGYATARLFEPIALRSVHLSNRVVISPMCQYAARAGRAQDWHMVHLGQFAIGGAGLIMTEAVAVEARGRITHKDLGLWTDRQIAPLRRITSFLKEQGAAPAIQLAHAGRKASIREPWRGGGPLDQTDVENGEAPWRPVAPGPLPYQEGAAIPRALSISEIDDIRQSFADAARRAIEAGFEVAEIHGAHGYLIHQFLSAVSNPRNDRYGGDLAGRMRFALEITEAVRAVWPADKPLFFRLSALDDADPSWTMADTVTFAHELCQRGVDVIDCSSGGIGRAGFAIRGRKMPGYQVSLAAALRRSGGMTIMAVGLVRTAEEAEGVLRRGDADLVAIGREALFNPHWPVQAARALGDDPGFKKWPPQYGWWLDYREKSLKASDPN